MYQVRYVQILKATEAGRVERERELKRDIKKMGSSSFSAKRISYINSKPKKWLLPKSAAKPTEYGGNESAQET
jgi:hypothetical protein